jgi:uncharacterized protein YsxB (DUF464 family)
MLDVTFYRDGRDRVSGVSARGHADFADHGEDIVCAAVSAILQAARLGLEAHIGPKLEAQMRSGALKLRWPAALRDLESVRAIVTTAELAIERIALRYPAHVRLQHRRVARVMGGGACERVTNLADRRRRQDV